MVAATDIGAEVHAVAKAVGLLDAHDGVNTGWFDQPLTYLRQLLTNADQRAAFLDALDVLAPHDDAAGAPPGDSWHAIVGGAEHPHGRLYLTAHPLPNGAVIGVAGVLQSAATSGLPSASLRLEVPLFKATGDPSPNGFTAAIGQPDTPLVAELRLDLDWVRAPHGPPITLKAVSVRAELMPAATSGPKDKLSIVFEQLDLDGSGPKDTPLDPQTLDAQAMRLVMGLLQSELQGADNVVQHVLGLLGLNPDMSLLPHDLPAVPAFPLDFFTQGPAALRTWLAALMTVSGGDAPIRAWLYHLAGALGVSAPSVAMAAGSDADPWRVTLVSSSEVAVALTVAAVTPPGATAPNLLLGLEVSLNGTGAVRATGRSHVTIASIPISGTGTAQALPAASLTLEAPGATGTCLIPALTSGSPPPGTLFAVQGLRGGLRWDGTNLAPLLELTNVTFNGNTYPVVDLTHANSVAQMADSMVRSEITSLLGSTGFGLHLAALLFLVAPASDPAWPYVLSGGDLLLLLSHPTQVLAEKHRTALLDTSHSWGNLLGEIAALVGLSGTVAGQGTTADPWRVSLESAGTLDLELAAWNAQADPHADQQQLRIGLRAAVQQDPFTAAWLAELLAFDISASGSARVQLLGGQHGEVSIAPVPVAASAAGFSLAAQSVGLAFDWQPGQPAVIGAQLTGLTLSSPDGDLTLARLAFPPPGGLDLHASANLAQMGIQQADLERLVRLLVANALHEWGGAVGGTLAALLGLSRALPGLPPDWPLLTDVAPGALLTDPRQALATWLNAVLTGVSVTGEPFVSAALEWLRGLLAGVLPGGEPPIDLPISGSGTPDDPWTLPLTGRSVQGADTLLWLEPDGPPDSWIQSLVGLESAVQSFPLLLWVAQQIASFVPSVRDALDEDSATLLAVGLQTLAAQLATGDGVVPHDAQLPSGASWVHGTDLHSAHPDLPSDPSAIAQILDWINTTAGASTPRVTLLLGPSFAPSDVWAALLNAASVPTASAVQARFSLRVPGVEPTQVDLSRVTVQSDFYTVDLADDGSGDVHGLAAQIGHVVSAAQALRPGAALFLVAHSTAGLAARAYVEGTPGVVRGLATLGTPHGGADLAFLREPFLANAIRFAQRLTAGGLADAPLAGALTHLSHALDGYMPASASGGTSGTLPVPAPYPRNAFGAYTGTGSLGTTAGLALASTLQTPLLTALRAWVGQTIASLTGNTGPTHPDPVYIAAGARLALGTPSDLMVDGAIAVRATVRMDLWRRKLTIGGQVGGAKPGPIQIRIVLTRPGGWLVGAAGAYALPALPGEPFDFTAPVSQVRLRWAELGLDLTPNSSGGYDAAPHLKLFDAAYQGATQALVALADAQAHAVLGALMAQLVAEAAGNPAVQELLAGLQALGVVVPDPHGGLGVSADALAALTTDPITYLAPRLRAALAGQVHDATSSATLTLPGFAASPTGPWTCPIAGLPLQLVLTPNPWTLRVETTGGGGLPLGTLPFGGPATIGGSITLPLATRAPQAEVALQVGAVKLAWSAAAGRLTLDAPPVATGVTLLPTSAAPPLNQLISRAALPILASSALSTVLGAVTQGQARVGPLLGLFASPGQALRDLSGIRDGNGGFDAAKVTNLLTLASRAIGIPSDTGLGLPAGLTLTASNPSVFGPTMPKPLALTLATTTDIGGTVGLSLGVQVDPLLHVTSQGTLRLTLALPGTWGTTAITFGTGVSGVTLAVQPASGPAINILPHFDGLGLLEAGAEALLPAVLNAALDQLAPHGVTPGTFLHYVLEVAQAAGIYDDTNRFSHHETQMTAMLQGNWLQNLSTTAQSAAIPALVSALGALGLHVTSVTTGGQQLARWQPASSPFGAGTLTVDAGWNAHGPVLRVTAAGVTLGSSPVTLDFDGGYLPGGTSGNATDPLLVEIGVGLDLASLLSVSATPTLRVGVQGGRFTLDFLTVGDGQAADLTANLLPTPRFAPSPASAQTLVQTYVIPLAASLLLTAGGSAWLSHTLWPQGPALKDVLLDAHLIKTSTDPLGFALDTVPPQLDVLAARLLSGLAQAASSARVTLVDSTGAKLYLALAGGGSGRIGLQLGGHLDLPIASIGLHLGFGGFDDPQTNAPLKGVELSLFQVTGSFPHETVDFAPGLSFTQIGLELSGVGDAPLINASYLRLGKVGAAVSFEIPNLLHLGTTPVHLSGVHAELDDFGLPLGQALGGGSSDSNPVVASLLRSNGDTTGHASGGNGDSQAIAPSLGISVDYDCDHSTLQIQFNGKQHPLWIGINRGFGPIFLHQIGVDLTGLDSGASLTLLVDGGVKVSSFDAEVYDLSVSVPFKHVTDPKHWSLDLQGLGVSYSSSGVSIAGGLIKRTNPLEYDGMLQGTVAGYGLAVLGSYAAVAQGGGSFASLFVFVAVDGPIGGPPFLFVTGLGGGLGYNRELTVPTDITAVPDFILVEAIDGAPGPSDPPAPSASDGTNTNTYPMSVLQQMRDALPPKRGALWLAAGLKFDTFVVVHSVAVLYVSLDGGFEIGLLGVSRMQMPESDVALVSIELALKARFSTAEMLLSIQAQLTDNSWLLSEDCKLTGGFAFVIWFRDHQFVVTLGGYHPAFHRPDKFPIVPRLGFHWSISDLLTIKGESYFALTSSAVMAGGRLEATFDADIVRAWFTAHADFLISWDPFYYAIGIGISVGASFQITISIFGADITISITISLGADLELEGPPLHGTVTVELEVCSLTIAFGPQATQKSYIADWSTFATKYLVAGGAPSDAVGIRVGYGMIQAEGASTPPTGQTRDDAWKLSPEFVLFTETRMPAMSAGTFYNEQQTTHVPIEVADANAHAVALAPMNHHVARSAHLFQLFQVNPDGSTVDVVASTFQEPSFSDWRDHFSVENIIGNFPAATWDLVAADSASASLLPAISGVRVIARARRIRPSAPIPIKWLVDDLTSRSRPLPFAFRLSFTAGEAALLGAQAGQIYAASATSAPAALLAGAQSVLASNGTFAAARAAAHLPSQGLVPVAARALRVGRSAPPAMAPAATGLDQKPMAQPARIIYQRASADVPVYVDRPRLRAVLHARPATTVQPATARTTVGALVAAATLPGATGSVIPRMVPPKAPTVLGAQLLRMPGAAAPLTHAAVAGKTVRSHEHGWFARPVDRVRMATAEAAIAQVGAQIAAGVTQVWDLPAGAGRTVFLRGSLTAARVTSLTAGGQVLADVELLAIDQGVTVAVPDAAAMVAIGCLGLVAQGTDAGSPAQGAVTHLVAPAGATAATGWQVGDLLAQLGPGTLLGRGAVVRCAAPQRAVRGGQQTVQAMTPAADVAASQQTVETWLPPATEVVALLLDRLDPQAPEADLAVAASGAQILTPPQHVADGNRVAVLYDVGTRDPKATHLSISVSSQAGWQLSGVVGLPGRAAEWAQRLQSDLARVLVPDGPLNAGGTVTVELRGGQA